MALPSKSSGISAITLLGSGNVIGTIISAIALILFSRYMGPTEFGLFSAAFAAMQIIVRIADLGTNMATERAIARSYGSDDRMADRLMRVGLWLKIGMFSMCVLLGWGSAPWLASHLHIDDILLIRSAIILAVGTIFFEYTTLVFQATHRFGMVARMTIVQALGKLVFGLLLIWKGLLSAASGLLVYGLMPGIGALCVWVMRPFTTYALPKGWHKEFKQIVSVAKWTGFAAVAATFADNIDTLIVKSLMSSYDTGIWAGAIRIAAFASLLGWSIGSVLNIRVAKYKDQAHLKKYLQKAWKISLIAFFVVLVAVPLAGIGISLSIGNAYLTGIIPLQILLIAAGLAAATSPYVALFYLFDKPKYYAIAGFLSTITLLLGDYIAIPRYGLVGAAYTRVAVRIVVCLFTVWYGRRAYIQHVLTVK